MPFFTDPFFYTALLSLLYALLSKVGYTRAAEAIYSTFVGIFCRAEHRQFLQNWKELKGAKGEVSKVSAQDEFAKWAKLQRKADKLQADFDKQYSSRQKSLLAVQYIGSVILRAISYFAIVSFLYLNTSTSVLPLDLVFINSFPFFEALAAFPSAHKGTLSVPVWALITNVAFKKLLEGFSI